MSYDPKWIRDDAVVKRDGTNDLTGDWDIGNQRRIVLEELQIRDASGLTISDTTANILVSVDNQTGLLSLRYGGGINEFSTATYSGNSYSADSNYSIDFCPDGTCMFLVDSSDMVRQHYLSIPWDISTASYSNCRISTSSFGSSYANLLFDNGTKFMTGSTSFNLYELSTPYDVTTMKQKYALDTSTGSVRGLAFGNNGYTLYQSNGASDVYQYDLDVAYDLKTATYNSKYLDVSSQDNNAYDIKMKPDGTELYVVTYSNDRVYQYTLSTPWDISTASYAGHVMSLNSWDSNLTGFAISEGGKTVYVCGVVTDSIRKYNLSNQWDLSPYTYDSEWSAPGITNPYSLCLQRDEEKIYLYINNGSTLYQYNLNPVYKHKFEFEAQASAPLTLSMKEHDTVVTVAGEITDYTEPITVNYSEAYATGRYLKFGISSPKDVHVSQVKFDLWKEV